MRDILLLLTSFGSGFRLHPFVQLGLAKKGKRGKDERISEDAYKMRHDSWTAERKMLQYAYQGTLVGASFLTFAKSYYWIIYMLKI